MLHIHLGPRTTPTAQRSFVANLNFAGEGAKMVDSTTLQHSLDAMSLLGTRNQDLKSTDLGNSAAVDAEENAAWDSDDWESHVPTFVSASEHASAHCTPAQSLLPIPPSCAVLTPSTLGDPRRLHSTTPATAGRGRGDIASHLEEDVQAVPRERTLLSALPFDGAHIVEFSSLTAFDTTTHLESFLMQFNTSPLAPIVRWVDDSHALAIFSDPETAQLALRGAGKYKLRSFAQSSGGARCMPAQQLAPPTPRPRTTAAVARRLIGNALGVSAAVRDKDGEAQLSAARKEKAAARVRRLEGLEKAWGDDDGGT